MSLRIPRWRLSASTKTSKSKTTAWATIHFLDVRLLVVVDCALLRRFVALPTTGIPLPHTYFYHRSSGKPVANLPSLLNQFRRRMTRRGLGVTSVRMPYGYGGYIKVSYEATLKLPRHLLFLSWFSPESRQKLLSWAVRHLDSKNGTPFDRQEG